MNSPSDYMEILRRRAVHLRSRISKAAERKQKLSYDEAEASAIEWALRELKFIWPTRQTPSIEPGQNEPAQKGFEHAEAR